jgi:hypothetical protein
MPIALVRRCCRPSHVISGSPHHRTALTSWDRCPGGRADAIGHPSGTAGQHGIAHAHLSHGAATGTRQRWVSCYAWHRPHRPPNSPPRSPPHGYPSQPPHIPTTARPAARARSSATRAARETANAAARIASRHATMRVHASSAAPSTTTTTSATVRQQRVRSQRPATPHHPPARNRPTPPAPRYGIPPAPSRRPCGPSARRPRAARPRRAPGRARH